MNIRRIIALAFLIAASKFSVAKEPDHLQQIDQALSSVTENNINVYRYIFKDKSGRTSDLNLLIAILLYGSDLQLQQALKLGADPNTVHAWGGLRWKWLCCILIRVAWLEKQKCYLRLVRWSMRTR